MDGCVSLRITKTASYSRKGAENFLLHLLGCWKLPLTFTWVLNDYKKQENLSVIQSKLAAKVCCCWGTMASCVKATSTRTAKDSADENLLVAYLTKSQPSDMFISILFITTIVSHLADNTLSTLQILPSQITPLPHIHHYSVDTEIFKLNDYININLISLRRLVNCMPNY